MIQYDCNYLNFLATKKHYLCKTFKHESMKQFDGRWKED